MATANEPELFGHLLRGYRTAEGLSQEELAERAGLSRRGISDLERGARRAPYPNTLRRLVHALRLGEHDREALVRARHVVAIAAGGVTTAGRGPGLGLTENGGSSVNPAVRSAEERHNLPADLSSFVGREQEVARVQSLLRTTRLLTLTGAGGVGKTRLALRVATEVAADYSDGAWLVELAPLADVALVPKALASALDVQEQPGRPLLETLIDALRRKELLLILDNCEHLVQACAELAAALLRACPRLWILATSRQVLRIDGETVWRVPSLQQPGSERTSLATAEQVVRAEAVQLLIERAREVQPSFVLADDNAAAVVQVCHQLDGIPLALELAAARLSVFSVEQIAARLGDRFKLLTGGTRTALPRQQTLLGTLDWSHGLLSDRERVLFRRLAVFAGGWTLEAVEAVCSGGELETDEILDQLDELAAKSLVVADSRAEGVRYRLLETVRQYAWEKLRAAGEEQRLCRRHLDWCLALVEEAEPHLYRTEQVRWLDRLEREHDNIRVALAWSNSQPDGSLALGRLVQALGWFWYLRGHLNVGRPWLEPAVSEIDPGAVRAGALLSLGWLAYGRGELEFAGALCEQSLACGGVSVDKRTRVIALTALSFTLRDRGEHERSRPLLDHSLALSREIGFCWGEGWSLYLMNQEASRRGDLASVAECCDLALSIFRDLGERLGLAYTLKDLARLKFEQGQYERATELGQESLTLSRELGNRRGICFALAALARGARRRGEYAHAADLLRQVLVIWQELGNRPHIANSLAGLGALAAVQHQPMRAARLFGAAEAEREAVGASLSRPELLVDVGYDESVATARKALGERAFGDAWAAGRGLPRDEAIDEALSATAAVSSRRSSRQGGTGDGGIMRLSNREREIAVLIAEGWSNPEIAAALVIAARTADTHVGHILTKLGLHTRAQVAAWVVSNGLATTRAS